MKKLSLDLDAITVESFETTERDAARGRTVFGRQVLPVGGGTEQYTCGCTEYGDETCMTDCAASQVHTCDPTENGNCHTDRMGCSGITGTDQWDCQSDALTPC